MADNTSATGQSGSQDDGLVVPDDVKQQHPDIVKLILGSKSMNTEERQYWINILPIMTPEQVQNLRDILENEKQQLAEIDQKYGGDIGEQDQQAIIEETQEKRRERREQREEEEQSDSSDKEAEALLEQIENL